MLNTNAYAMNFISQRSAGRQKVFRYNQKQFLKIKTNLTKQSHTCQVFR
jgi:hypothetical protein